MSVLLVTYTLRNRQRDYTSLFEAIKNNSNEWWHFLVDSWIVSTHHSPETYAQLLYPHIEQADSFLVVRLTRHYQGWLPKEAWDWLNRQIY